jgi:phage-related baseplate assembly protein
MTFRPTDIDLSQLPPPSVIEPLDFEGILDAIKGDFEARWATARAADPSLPEYDVGMLETDPAVILMQAFAYREMLLRARVNDAARAVMLAYARGSDLDHLAALFGVARMTVREATQDAPAVMESDERLRRRVLLALEAFSTAGPEGAYVFHTLSAHADIVDCHVFNPRDYSPGEMDGQVHVVVLSSAQNGVPSTAVLTAVANALRAAAISGVSAYQPLSEPSRVRPLTDRVTIFPARRKMFAVKASLRIGYGPDAAVVRSDAIASLNAYLASRYKVGRTVALSGIYDAFHSAVTETVTLAAPTSDIVPDPYEVAFCTGIDVTVETAS